MTDKTHPQETNNATNLTPVVQVENWQEDINRALHEQERPKARLLLIALLVTVVVLLVWAAFAEIDEVTRGQGKVIPSSQVQIVQSQDGGVVTELLVAEGDFVSKGQLLVKLDATRSNASYRENLTQMLWLEVQAERLKALADGGAFEPSDQLRQQIPKAVAQEETLFFSSLEELGSSKWIAAEQLTQRKQELVELRARREQTQRSYRYAKDELDVTLPLKNSGAVSEVEIIRLRREVSRLKGELAQNAAQIERVKAAIAEASGKISEVELEFKNEMREQLSETLAKINSLKESSQGLSDRVNQTSVRSPVNGTVKSLYFNTIGGVVMPGREVVEIVPKDDALLLEVKISPRDIGFLRPQQKALVKFTAYDFVVYGGLDAEVVHIGADTETDEEGNAFYSVRVKTYESDLGQGRPIIPGMVVEVDILTGKKTILQYLLKPLLRAKQYALTER